MITDIRVLIKRKKAPFVSEKRKIKRDIKIVDLKGITKSTMKGANTIVIHVKNQHDEHLFTSKVDEINENLK